MTVESKKEKWGIPLHFSTSYIELRLNKYHFYAAFWIATPPSEARKALLRGYHYVFNFLKTIGCRHCEPCGGQGEAIQNKTLNICR